jgi:hypothetical protein
MNVVFLRIRFHAVFLLLLGALFAGFSLTACAGGDSTFASGTWRYKMTVTVATPEGDKVGSAVREVSVARGWQPFPESQPSVKLKGEAVVVNLGKRGVLFALLDGAGLGTNYGTDLPAKVFMPQGGWLSAAGIKAMSNLTKTRPVELPFLLYPRMVYFKNINDPMSASAAWDKINFRAYQLDKNSAPLTMVGAFGSGVSLKSVTIEMTAEPVTSGIYSLLPWLKGLNGGYLDGGFSSRGAPMELHAGDFIEGE